MNEPPVEWGHASQALPGEPESGDRCVVRVADGQAMFAVIDGLGHGREAAFAARTVVDEIEARPDEPILALFQRCHARLRATRGAAMTIAKYDAATHRIQWLGAGNVRTALWRAGADGRAELRDMLVYSGTVGVQLPTLEVLSLEARTGDLLCLATDGLQVRFTEGLRNGEPPGAQAERLLNDYRVRTDDALILLARICR